MQKILTVLRGVWSRLRPRQRRRLIDLGLMAGILVLLSLFAGGHFDLAILWALPMVSLFYQAEEAHKRNRDDN